MRKRLTALALFGITAASLSFLFSHEDASEADAPILSCTTAATGAAHTQRCRDRLQNNPRVCGYNPITGRALPCTSIPYTTNFTLGTECSCATSIAAGNHSEAVTNNRDGGAYCTKHNWISPIATGDMIWCSANNSVRAMSGDDVSIGFLSELGTHNYSGPGNTGIRSQDFTAAPWANTGTGGLAAPVISPPDAGPCPDGTITATRVQFPANTLSPAQQSVIYNLTGTQGGGAAGSMSAYLRGYAADGGIGFVIGSNRSGPLNYSVNFWTRAIFENQLMDTQVNGFGNEGYYETPQVQYPATDLFICFLQGETSPYVTSYTPGDRDSDRLTASVMLPLGSNLVMSGTVLPEGDQLAAVVTVGYDYATWLGAEQSADGGLHCRNQWSSIDDYVPDAGIWLPNWSKRNAYTFACGWEAIPLVNVAGEALPQESWSGVIDGCLNGHCVDGGHVHNPLQSISGNFERVELGGHQNNVDFNSQPNAILKSLSFDSAAQRSVFLFGDSIVGGAHAEETIHNMIWLDAGITVSTQNHAQSGWTIEQCRTAWDATLAAVRAHPTVACNTYMFAQCGTNSPDDAGYTLGLMEDMLLDAQDAGVHICAATITPRDDHCPYVTAFNNGLQSWGALNGISIADSYTPLHTNQAGCSMDPAYQTDSVHPNDAGTVVMVNSWLSTCGWTH